MKLLLKRVPEPEFQIACDGMMGRPHQKPVRPFALFTDAGEILPQQKSATINSVPGQCPTVTVTFFLNGEDVKMVGDD
jgi:hypothetical protein